jgi:hypothetical protein
MNNIDQILDHRDRLMLENARLKNLLLRVTNHDHCQQSIPTVKVPRELILEIRKALDLDQQD